MDEEGTASPPPAGEGDAPDGGAPENAPPASGPGRPVARAGDASRRPLRLRRLLRAIHRDVGYLAVGLTFVYAISGLAVNHIVELGDTSYSSYERVQPLTGALPEDDAAAAALVLAQLGVEEEPKSIYRASATQLFISFDRRNISVDAESGEIVDQGEEPRFFLRAANWLHLNRGKRAWTYIADAYAVMLLFLAISGSFMLPGRQGLIGRGGILIAIGVAVPVIYVCLASP